METPTSAIDQLFALVDISPVVTGTTAVMGAFITFGLLFVAYGAIRKAGVKRPA